MLSRPKSDIQKAEWEENEFPSVCERCLGDNPYIRMTKESYGQECKICSRPCTVFRWLVSREQRQKHTEICVACARMKNCCQSCMLDLQFGLPMALRDAALKLVDSGPTNDINREFFAQNNQQQYEGSETPYDNRKASTVARNLVKRVEKRDPYPKKNPRRTVADNEAKQLLRTAKAADAAAGVDRPTFPIAKIANGQVTLSVNMEPPKDKKIASLFLIGVEDELADYKIRKHFEQFGPVRSVVCSHKAKCAFVNFKSRAAAESAASAYPKGEVFIDGFKLRVQWGKPRALGGGDAEERNSKLAKLVMKGSVQNKSVARVGDSAERASNVEETKVKQEIAEPVGSTQHHYPSQKR
ncbi:RNA-binding protein Cwf5 [Schizosaccharomyces japonicus yFS275]|uniref:RNA-binding protein Cwf5 n=1 Tax=Schizosaccharomyces japonicus (strain yFS275 / FY16936) TaxID=402676 RepID=B6K5Z1_SCHJY|nr:RNA-binding protein Cwf5 [Schizosaccharomyces japonicus yFS275]EEB08945.1 RNA-binding protein Cwf5 [Schizosaccharomyces japonicus yFS275]